MNHSEPVLTALSYVKKLSGTTILVKVGGAALQEADLFQRLIQDIALVRDVGISVVLVHGGGPAINAELTARGISWEFIDGQRVTTPEMMEVIENVLGGTVNRKVVRSLNLAGVPAVGFSGIEAATLRVKPAARKLGQVGVIQDVDTSLIRSILEAETKDGRGAIPVIAPIGVGLDGKTFNVNADWAASRIAQALGIKKVLFLTDQQGILGADGKVAAELDAGELANFIEEGLVKGGMLTKTRTILEALKNGVEAIHVIDGKRPHALVSELFTHEGAGTICRLRSHSPRGEENGGNA